MQLTMGRRRFLAGGAASLALLAAGPCAASSGRVRLMAAARWETGNRRLVPATLHDGRVYFGGNRTVGAVSIASGGGAAIWRRDLMQPCQFRPRVADGVIVAGGTGFLTAWHAADGAPIWDAKPDARFGVPLIHNGHLYCGDGNRLVACDLHTGRVVWSFNALPDTEVAYGPAASGDTVFVGPGDGRLYALAATDGALRWSVDRMKEWQYLRQIYIAGDVLVAGTYQEKLLGLSVTDGHERWAVNAGNFINSHHVADGTAYFWSPTGWVFAVNTATGDIRWQHRTTDYGNSPGNWGTLVAELATAGDRLFALDLSNTVHVLHRENGEELTRLTAPGYVQPFVLPLSSDRIFLGTADGALGLFPLPAQF